MVPLGEHPQAPYLLVTHQELGETSSAVAHFPGSVAPGASDRMKG